MFPRPFAACGGEASAVASNALTSVTKCGKSMPLLVPFPCAFNERLTLLRETYRASAK
jgi:hypothetical protein